MKSRYEEGYREPDPDRGLSFAEFILGILVALLVFVGGGVVGIILYGC